MFENISCTFKQHLFVGALYSRLISQSFPKTERCKRNLNLNLNLNLT